MARLSKKSPCHCGSGKKYKHCHWAADHPEGVGTAVTPADGDPGDDEREDAEWFDGEVPAVDEPAIEEAAAAAPPTSRPPWAVPAFALAVVAIAIAVGVLRGSVGDGLAAGLAGAMAFGIYLVVRQPPVPKPQPKNTSYQRAGIGSIEPPPASKRRSGRNVPLRPPRR